MSTACSLYLLRVYLNRELEFIVLTYHDAAEAQQAYDSITAAMGAWLLYLTEAGEPPVQQLLSFKDQFGNQFAFYIDDVRQVLLTDAKANARAQVEQHLIVSDANKELATREELDPANRLIRPN